MKKMLMAGVAFAAIVIVYPAIAAPDDYWNIMGPRYRANAATTTEAQTSPGVVDELRAALTRQIVAREKAEALVTELRRALTQHIRAEEQQRGLTRTYYGRYGRAVRAYRAERARRIKAERQAGIITAQAQRIDRVLAGHALAGHGRDFVLAARKHNLPNPYLSAAIAGVESTFGDHCFKPHNSWGWFAGGSFDSHTTAINAHAAYLARRWHRPASSWSMAGYCVPSDPWRGHVAGIERRIRNG